MKPSSFFKEINSWQDFVGATDRLDKKGKGDAFELLTKYFFLLNPRYSFYDNVWLWKDVRSLNLKNSSQWLEYVKEKNIKNIPRKPDQTYSLKGWNGWKDFLGTTNNKKFDSFHKAQEWALKNNIKTKKEWKESQLRPDCFPKNPDYCAEYKKEWISWNKFLNKKDYLGFIEAKKFIASLKLKNQSEWRKFCKSSEFPSFIPKNPKKEYPNQWLGLGDWLGNGRVADQLKVFRSFEDVKKLVKDLGIKSQKEWFQYAKSGGSKPEDVPYKPYRYKKEWKGWKDFLGKE